MNNLSFLKLYPVYLLIYLTCMILGKLFLLQCNYMPELMNTNVSEYIDIRILTFVCLDSYSYKHSLALGRK